MKKIRFLLVLLLALAMAFSIAACDNGSSSGQDDTPGGQDEPGGQDTPTPAPEEGPLQLSADYIVLGVGRTKQLTLAENGVKIAAADAEWEVSGQAVTVQNGLLTGAAEGECTVTARYGGNTATAQVIVTAIRGLTVAESELVLPCGGAAKIEASVGELQNDTIVSTDAAVLYTAGDPSVASVDAEGNVSGLACGAATIKVQSGELTASVSVYVCDTIATAAGFREKISADPDGYFLLTDDLDFSGISYLTLSSFDGMLFGGGHKLYGLTLLNTKLPADTYGGALFNTLSGTVRDVYISALFAPGVTPQDTEYQQGMKQFAGTLANFLLGTVENVYVSVTFEAYPWFGENWNEAGAVCGRLRGNAVIRNCIVEYACSQESNPRGENMADIHTIYGMTDGNTQNPVIEDVYILNRGAYKKDYRDTGDGYFGSVQPLFSGVYEFEDVQALEVSVQGTAAEKVFNYSKTV